MRKLVLSFAPLLLLSFPALAWEPEMHRSIVKAAMGLSPAAEARVPLEYRDALFKDVVEPDFSDRDCRFHCVDAGPKEPALLAEQLLAQILAPKVPLKPYLRAQLVGRYIHYVADAVAPPPLRKPNAQVLANFFANKDFIFFREHRPPLGAPLSQALRKRAEEMAFANVDAEGAGASLFRCALNTVADALLLLPPREGANATAAAADDGPVWFLVNRMDTGLGSKATEGHYEKSTSSGTRTTHLGPLTWESSGSFTTTSWVSGTAGGGPSSKRLALLERRGVQLAEMVVRKEGDKVILHGIFFNNDDRCAEKVGIRAGNFTFALPGVLPPHVLKTFEATGPADLLSRRLDQGFDYTPCPASTASAGPVIPTRPRVVFGNVGAIPRFDDGRAEGASPAPH
ncbi:MAG TPA: hypothetical protein VGR00_11565 [Thermoanaerobaculia bacterium]|jgi:hypothetical protein|nr:hypothetical protein [Thermoanaerobaculia bacterium]